MTNRYRLRIHSGLFRLLLIVFLGILVDGCSPVRRLKEQEYLLVKNKIKNNKTNIPDADLLIYAKQKPNRRILNFFRFHLQVYSLVNEEKFNTRYEKRLSNRNDLNIKRVAKGKKPKKSEPLSLPRWLLSIGEAPVILDSSQVRRSTIQIQQYLINHGYFDAIVKDSIDYSGGKQRADVIFTLDAGEPYRYQEIEYLIEDTDIRDLYMQKWAFSLIKKGDLFNSDLLDQERDRVTNLLRNEGYYSFVKNYISFAADTSLGKRQIKLKMIVDNPTVRVPGYVDSTREISHIRYKINNIYITADYSLRPDTSINPDTLYFDNVHYISKQGLEFKPKALKPAVSINRGDLYSKDGIDLTYRRIAQLNAFKFINLNFKPVGSDTSGLLDLNIRLSPKPRQSVTFQTQGTNTAGNFGVFANLIYQNRNLIKGLELFELRLTGGLEVQRILGDLESNNPEGNVATFLPFNTILLGPEASVSIPKIPRILRFLGENYRSTRIATYFNFQQRPDYLRSIFTSVYGFSARKTPRVTLAFNPAEINFVNVNLSSSFEKLLNSSNNLFLKNSFKSQFIAAGKFTRTYNSQIIGTNKSFTFFQWNLESAGLILNGSRRFFKNPGVENAGTPLEKYIVFGVPYSQYFRFDSDYRYFRYFNKSSSIGFRWITGLGIPYGNSTVMPFEKSFFVGGANSIRAWIARSLGPGGYIDSTGVRIDQIGDIKLEWNVEFRQKLYKMFEGAAFVDAGNIWLRQKDEQRLNAEFAFDRFYREIAVGAGIGFRLNFDYFIIRLDAAHPVREPGYPEGKRWSFDRVAMKNVNFNFGIGYPF